MKTSETITPNIEVNVKIAEHQEEYQTVYAHLSPGLQGPITFAIELEEEEIKEIQENKRIYISTLTFGRAMQPIYITGSAAEIEEYVKSQEEVGVSVSISMERK